MANEQADITITEASAPQTSDAKVERSVQDERKKYEKPTPGRLYFVRLPKPAELSSNEGLEADKDAIDAKLRKLSDELQPIVAERSKAQAELSEAREILRELKAQIDDKELTLNPYQAEKKAAFQERETQREKRDIQRAAEKKAREDQFRAELNAKQKIKNDFSSQYGHLGVSNDDEIDAKLRELEFRQQHESLTINEEKAIIKQIKQLQDSREAVRAYSQWSAQDRAEREAKQAQRKNKTAEADPTYASKAPEKVQSEEERTQAQEMAQLREEVNALWEDFKTQLDLKNKQVEAEAVLKKQVDELFEKRDALRKEREEIWEQIQAHRTRIRAANQPYAENRSFSNTVRELVKKGKLEEARQLCLKQSEEMISQYETDTAFRTEYNKLWDASVDYKRPAASASESHHKAAASVIAEALEAAKRSVAVKSGKLKEAETKPIESSLPAGNGSTLTDSLALPFTASRPEIPGLGEPASRSKPKKEKKIKQSPVELPKLDDTEFVPPPSVLKSVTGPSEEELKAQEIAHNRAAAAEAAMRKEKRKLTQEKKRQQKRQRAELQAKVQPKDESADEVAKHEDDVPSDENKGGSEPETVPSSAIDGPSKPKARNVRALNTNAARAALAPKSRPFVRRKGFLPLIKSYARNAYSTAEERPLMTGMVTAAAIILAIVPVIYHFS